MPDPAAWIAGVYPLLPKAPGSTADAEAIFHACRDLAGFSGFELPFTGALHAFDEPWLLSQLCQGDTVVITQIPGVWQRRAVDPAFGLASTDDEARHRALAYTAQTRDAVRRVNDRLGQRAVAAVALHSAPGGRNASVSAFGVSLDDLAAMDWDGARLVIEHCDAHTGPTPAKGYLTLDDELELGLGVVVNWGRSAIEGNSPATPLEHVRRARSAGALAGLMFSGASDRPQSRGGEWADVHLAPQEALSADQHSLLTAPHAAAALAAAGSGILLGLKVSAPAEASTAERVRLLRDSAAALF